MSESTLEPAADVSESALEPATECSIQVRVNGEPVEDQVPARMILADFLRERRRLSGTHVACGVGACGACLVHIDGRSARSCTVLAVQADGRHVRTVEGVGQPDGALNEVQEAFLRFRAAQCGYCTPGFVMLVTELLEEIDDGARPDDDAIRTRLAGHICRCTGYAALLDATRSLVADRLDGRATG